MSKNKISNNKLIGIIMLVALVLPYIPVVNALASIGTLALFLIAIYLIVKG